VDNASCGGRGITLENIRALLETKAADDLEDVEGLENIEGILRGDYAKYSWRSPA
jgi:hypothetical protein